MCALLCKNNACKQPLRGGDLQAGLNMLRGSLDYTASSRAILEEYGPLAITAITIKRTPVEGSKVLDYAKKKLGLDLLKSKPFDTLYHIFMEVELEGQRVICEKNEVVKISIAGSERPGTESIRIFKPPKVSLEKMLQKTQDNLGSSSYFRYDAFRLSCQHFLSSITTANRFGRKEVRTFVLLIF